MSSTQYGGRTFDRIERVDPRSFNYLVMQHPTVAAAVTPLVYVSPEDKVLQAQIDVLKAQIAALSAVAPVPPAPVPIPPPPAPPSAATIYTTGQVLDQKQTGMCVGYGWAGYLMTSPKPDAIVIGSGGDDESSTADAIYDQARVEDGSVPVDDPQGGASTTGGAKAAKDLGYIQSYSWALNAAQIVAGMQAVGPCVLGVPWRSTMMTPDLHGVLDVGDKSQDVGGHEFFLWGYFPMGSPGNPSAVEDMVAMRNSWGPSWGATGSAYIPVASMVSLMADGGDATFPVKT